MSLPDIPIILADVLSCSPVGGIVPLLSLILEYYKPYITCERLQKLVPPNFFLSFDQVQKDTLTHHWHIYVSYYAPCELSNKISDDAITTTISMKAQPSFLFGLQRRLLVFPQWIQRVHFVGTLYWRVESPTLDIDNVPGPAHGMIVPIGEPRMHHDIRTLTSRHLLLFCVSQYLGKKLYEAQMQKIIRLPQRCRWFVATQNQFAVTDEKARMKEKIIRKAEDAADGYCEEFWYAGQRCRVKRAKHGLCLCGYIVDLSSDNLLSVFPNRLDLIDVHGGLTAYMGFDTAHVGDYNPYADEVLSLIGGVDKIFAGSTLKLKPWVKMETQFLALQVASQQPVTVWLISRLQVRFRRRYHRGKLTAFAHILSNIHSLPILPYVLYMLIADYSTPVLRAPPYDLQHMSQLK